MNINTRSSDVEIESKQAGSHKQLTSYRPKLPIRRRSAIIALGLGVLAILLFFVILSRLRERAELVSSIKETGRTPVSVVHPRRADAKTELELPANVRAFLETPIYARTNGYVERWFVDIGSKVKAGHLLAKIDTPEVDQQLNQMEAAQAQAQANLDLARITHERYKGLLKYEGVSQQEVDQTEGAYKARQADLKAAIANVDRLKDLQSYQKVVAPFDGIITARKIDVGDLIAEGTTKELFRLAQTDILRVYVNVPEIYSRSMVPGVLADLRVAEFPNRIFPGKVVRTAGAILPASRTLLTEVQVPNPKGELLPGAFGEVRFQITLPQAPLIIPSNTLLFRSKGTQVALVDKNQTVHLQNVVLGHDFGTSVEVLSGLTEDASIILNPYDSISEGAPVTIEQGETPKATVMSK
jgi:RND family efflux transporter MFP subunit